MIDAGTAHSASIQGVEAEDVTLGRRIPAAAHLFEPSEVSRELIQFFFEKAKAPIHPWFIANAPLRFGETLRGMVGR